MTASDFNLEGMGYIAPKNMSADPINPIFLIARKTSSKSARLLGVLLDPWDLTTARTILGLLLLLTIGNFFASPVGDGGGVLPVFILFCLVTAARLWVYFVNSRRSNFGKSFRSELRLSKLLASDLMITPLGPADFAEAHREWIRLRIRRRFFAWLLLFLVLFVYAVSANDVWVGLICVCALYCSAVQGIQAYEGRISALGESRMILRNMRADFLKTPRKTFSPDPAVGSFMEITLGWWMPIYIVLLTWLMSLLALAFDSFLELLGVRDINSLLLLGLSALIMGIVRGVLLVQIRRNTLKDNLRAALRHMTFMLDTLHDELASGKPHAR